MPIAHSDWPRLLTLVDQALDLPAQDRPGWLRNLELPAPLNDALEGLLAQRRAIETGNFLGGLPMLPPHASGRLEAGRRIGPWRLLKEIGQGGMSSVWLAERADDQMTRRVALKLPHAGPGQDVLAARLLRERDILAALEHRNIARLYDVGLTDAGTPYLVMEYVPGDTLLAHADAQRLTIAQRLALFQQVLRSVQYAHGKLVLHRDIKPSNILVNEAGDVKLLDFGIAKPLAAEGATRDESELTRAAGRQLTPSYASPEQLRGHPLSTASDVYSLGVVLYELLCGQRPHEAQGGSAARLEDAVLNLEPKAPSRQNISADKARSRGLSTSALRKLLAGDLDAIVLKALAKAPELRYSTAEALDADIGRWRQGRTVSAQAPSSWYYMSKFVLRNRWAVVLGTTAVMMLISISGVALLKGRAAEEEAARANAVLDFLQGTFKQADLNLAPSKDLTARVLLERSRQRAMSSPTLAPPLKAQLLQYIGQAQVNMSDRKGADQSLAEAARIYEQLGEPRARYRVMLDQADNALAMGQHQEAQDLVERIASSQARDAKDALLTGRLTKAQGTVAMYRGDWQAAKGYLDQYLESARAHEDWDAASLVEVLLSQATVASRYGNDLPGARDLIEQAIRTFQIHPELPVALKMDALNYRQSVANDWGQFAAVERVSSPDVTECDRRLSPESQPCFKLKIGLIGALLKLGKVEAANSKGNDLLSMVDPSSPRDQLVATSILVRAMARGSGHEQLPVLVKKLQDIALAQTGEPLDAVYRFVAMSTLAESYILANQPEDALRWVTQADALMKDDPSVPPLGARKTRLLEGVALHLMGQDERALNAMSHFCSPEDQPTRMTYVLDHYFSLNCVAPLTAIGRPDAALSLLKKAVPILNDNLGSASPTSQRAQRWLDSVTSTGHVPRMSSPGDALFG